MRVDAIAEVEVTVAGHTVVLDDVMVCSGLECPVWSVSIAAMHGWATCFSRDGAEVRVPGGGIALLSASSTPFFLDQKVLDFLEVRNF